MEPENKNKIIAVGVGIVLLILDVVFLFKNNRNLMYFLGVILVLITLLPFVIGVTVASSKQKEKESRFLEFTRDLVENVRSGTPIGKAIINLKTRDYGTLTPHVQKLINQLTLGIPLSEGLLNFARDTKSKVISRAIGLISEAERSGGEIESILISVANSINQIEQLKKEQKSAVYSLVVQGYIIFFVFIIIVLVLQYYIIPMTGGIGDINNLNAEVVAVEPKDLGGALLALLIVQSIFAGIVIGKISEGNIFDGIKHSFILVSITLLISLGAAVLLK
jgi:flagellar protein FlaJ